MNDRILIVGGGIAGLTLALALNARGYRSLTILERSIALEQAGSGINILPLASRELADLGLLEALEPLSVQLDQLNYTTWDGHLIWSEPKGRSAGFAWPQLSISRSRLHATLLRTVIERCGRSSLVGGSSVAAIKRLPKHHLAIDTNNREFAADLIVGADGIRSAVRQVLFPDLAPLRIAPSTVYRGSFWGDGFLDTKSMYIAGDGLCKFVVYPMAVDSTANRTLHNWAAAMPDSSPSHHPLGNWNVRVSAHELAGHFTNWSLNGMRPEQVIRDSGAVYAYPMVDIDPLPAWSNGEDTVLIGDAAHGMYPIGSNGATQSIVDAVALAQALATRGSRSAAIAEFEGDRITAVQAIQRANREQGPEVVVDIAAQRRRSRRTAPLEAAFPYEERLGIASAYAQLTSVTQSIVNRDSRYKWSGS